MSLYLDSAYIAKCYLNEPDAPAVREVVRDEAGLTSSAWCRAEVACVFQRHVREGSLTRGQAHALHELFLDDVTSGVWNLVPVSSEILDRVEANVRKLAAKVFLRSGDAVHLTSAQLAGFREVWTSDRHMLAAAPAFGLRGRSA